MQDVMPMRDVLEYDGAKFARLFEYVFGRAVIIKNAAECLSLVRRVGQLDAVTMEGEKKERKWL